MYRCWRVAPIATLLLIEACTSQRGPLADLDKEQYEMISRPRSFVKWLSIFVLSAVIATTVLPSASQANQQIRNLMAQQELVSPDQPVAGSAVASALAEAEQCTLSSPAMTGSSNGDGNVQLGDVVSSQPPASNFQPTAPFYATFYYPWYGAPAADGGWSYWTGQGNKPPNTWFSHYLPDPLPARFDPSGELYSSHDAGMLFWQFGKMAEAKLEVAISSWWGPGDRTDNNFRYILTDVMKRSGNPYPNLRWALYYELESISDPTAAQIAADLNYIADNYAGQPGFLKIGGKPVIFVYAGAGDGAGMAQRWYGAKALAKLPFYVVLKVFMGYKTVSPQPDSWHQYGPAMRSSNQAPYSFTVSPGFWFDSSGTVARLARNLAAFRTAVGQMVKISATWKLVTTWNEWGEGTSVEPGEQVRLNTRTGHEEVDPGGAPFKNAYVQALRDLLQALEAGTGAAAMVAIGNRHIHRLPNLAEREASFLQAHITVAADHHVVEHGNVQQLASFHQHLGHTYILRTGRGIAAGVVVDNNDRGAVGANRLAEDLADAHDGSVEATGVDASDPQNVVLGIEQNYTHLLLFEQPHLEEEQIGYILRAPHLGPVLGKRHQETATEFEGGFDLRRFGFADIVGAAHLFKVGLC